MLSKFAGSLVRRLFSATDLRPRCSLLASWICTKVPQRWRSAVPKEPTKAMVWAHCLSPYDVEYRVQLATLGSSKHCPDLALTCRNTNTDLAVKIVIFGFHYTLLEWIGHYAHLVPSLESETFNCYLPTLLVQCGSTHGNKSLAENFLS